MNVQPAQFFRQDEPPPILNLTLTLASCILSWNSSWPRARREGYMGRSVAKDFLQVTKVMYAIISSSAVPACQSPQCCSTAV